MIKFPADPISPATNFRSKGWWWPGLSLSLIAVNLTTAGNEIINSGFSLTAIATKWQCPVHLLSPGYSSQNGQVPQAAGEIAVAVASSQTCSELSTDMNQLFKWHRNHCAYQIIPLLAFGDAGKNPTMGCLFMAATMPI